MKEKIDWKYLNEHIRLTLDKKELKLIFDMHGEIGLEEYLQDIMNSIKTEIKELK